MRKRSPNWTRGRIFDKPLEEVRQHTIQFAESVIPLAQKIRLGKTGDCVFPSVFFLFDGQCNLFPVWGELLTSVQHAGFSEKEQTILAVKTITMAMDSPAILQVTEAWSARKCHGCGKDYTVISPGHCPCGQDVSQPSENQYREEGLFVVLIFRPDLVPKNCNNAVIWSYKIVRNILNRITGYLPEASREGLFISGRMAEVWSLEPHEVPHFLVNYPIACDALGLECEDADRVAADLVERSKPDDFELLQFNFARSLEEANLILNKLSPN